MYHDKDFIFAMSKKAYGYPVKRDIFAKRMKRLLRIGKFDVQTLSPHSIRHTHTSLLAEAGVGLETIMQRLGHKNDRITRTVYLHVTNTLKKEASEKFGILMRNVVKM